MSDQTADETEVEVVEPRGKTHDNTTQTPVYPDDGGSGVDPLSKMAETVDAINTQSMYKVSNEIGTKINDVPSWVIKTGSGKRVIIRKKGAIYTVQKCASNADDQIDVVSTLEQACEEAKMAFGL